jgi:hypothetical protein
MIILRAFAFSLGLGILGTAMVVSQIPAKGSDFPTLSNLRWGITMKDARDSIGAKRELNKTTSTTLSYEDTLLNAKGTISLKFTEDSTKLNNINFVISKPTKELSQSIEKYLVNRYGDKYVSKKEQKTKIFITVEIEMKLWRLNGEGVGMGVFSRGDEIMGLNIFYGPSSSKRQ